MYRPAAVFKSRKQSKKAKRLQKRRQAMQRLQSLKQRDCRVSSAHNPCALSDHDKYKITNLLSFIPTIKYGDFPFMSEFYNELQKMQSAKQKGPLFSNIFFNTLFSQDELLNYRKFQENFIISTTEEIYSIENYPRMESYNNKIFLDFIILTSFLLAKITLEQYEFEQIDNKLQLKTWPDVFVINNNNNINYTALAFSCFNLLYLGAIPPLATKVKDGEVKDALQILGSTYQHRDKYRFSAKTLYEEHGLDIIQLIMLFKDSMFKDCPPSSQARYSSVEDYLHTTTLEIVGHCFSKDSTHPWEITHLEYQHKDIIEFEFKANGDWGIRFKKIPKDNITINIDLSLKNAEYPHKSCSIDVLFHNYQDYFYKCYAENSEKEIFYPTILKDNRHIYNINQWNNNNIKFLLLRNILYFYKFNRAYFIDFSKIQKYNDDFYGTKSSLKSYFSEALPTIFNSDLVEKHFNIDKELLSIKIDKDTLEHNELTEFFDRWNIIEQALSSSVFPPNKINNISEFNEEAKKEKLENLQPKWDKEHGKKVGYSEFFIDVALAIWKGQAPEQIRKDLEKHPFYKEFCKNRKGGGKKEIAQNTFVKKISGLTTEIHIFLAKNGCKLPPTKHKGRPISSKTTS